MKIGLADVALDGPSTLPLGPFTGCWDGRVSSWGSVTVGVGKEAGGVEEKGEGWVVGGVRA